MADGFFAASTWAKKDTGPGPQGPGSPKCGQCGLYKTCKSPKMPATGEGKRSILFVGEAPGETEDIRNEQFVGQAGETLREMCLAEDIDVDQCWKVNAANCRPEANEIKPIHIESCRPLVLSTIERLKPNVIVLLGMSAVQSLIGPEWGGDLGTMSQWAGWTIPSERYGAWLCPTYHPSYVMRTTNDPVLVRLVRSHLRAAAALEHEKCTSVGLVSLRGAVEPITDPRLARLRIKELAKKTGHLAFDYETTGLKPERPEHRIVSVSFCLDGEDTFACPISEDIIKPLIRVLTNSALKKVASNLKFEERWSQCKLKTPVEGWHWDIMLAAHCHDNRKGITSIKFQTYIHLGVGSYASWVDEHFQTKKELGGNALNSIGKIHMDDLLIYNSIDSLVEFKIMEVQKRLMGLEGL